MNTFTSALSILGVLAALVVALPARAADDASGGYHLTYTVSGQVVTVVSAVTPYDSSPPAREAFLHWFKRGFETVLAGRSPLMIEWDVTPEARAGQSGYDFGMDEAARYLKVGKKTDQPQQSAPIPPALDPSP
jgi:hypothetical protein